MRAELSEREREMNGFHGGGGAATAVVERDYVGISSSAAARPEAEEREEPRGGEENDEELELGLSLGAKKAVGGRAAAWGEYCRVLTAKDFPSLASRPSPRSSTSSVSSSSATLGGAAVGTKRTADSVASDAVGSTSPPSPVVVGWPPIRAFRINTLINQSRDSYSESDAAAALKKSDHSNVGKDRDAKGAILCFVKVNMDGDPIGRKVDLNAHHSYETLALALEAMFHKPTMAAIHGVKASRLLDGSSEFALTYEDKDGDWMLVGDVPWGMFLDTVKRLRIMRTSEASGLAVPRFQPSKSAGTMRNKPA